ncbi:hypothetical protein ACNOYE_28680 [Nannocystaceae bacterium ST9]
MVLMLACNGEPASEPAKPEPTPDEPAKPEPTPEAEPEAPREDSTALLVRLLSWLPSDTLAVSYDRMPERWSPAVLASVFALPPKAADLLDERRLLDEALAQAFETEAGPPDLAWLGPQSMAFTLPIIRHAYLVRPLLKPASELDSLFTSAGFMREEIEGKVVWLPKGAFPWRMAILDEQTIAFVPADPGAGVQPLLDAAAAPASPVEAQVSDALGKDPMIELTLLAAGPLMHYDTDAAINQIQFALRRPGPNLGYEGLVVMMPDGDPSAVATELRERSTPEENLQVQELIKLVEFIPEPTMTPPQVIGRLTIAPDQLKHFRARD